MMSTAAAMSAILYLSGRMAEVLRNQMRTARVSAGLKILRGDEGENGFQFEKLRSGEEERPEV